MSEGGTTTVAVAKGTYPDRYSSAEIVEFDTVPKPTKIARLAEVGLARTLGQERRASAASLQPAVSCLPREVSWAFSHNAPEAGWCDWHGMPHALYCHNRLFRTYSPREIRRCADGWDHIIVVSEFLRQALLGRAPWLEGKVSVAHNGVDTLTFFPKEEARDRPRVIFVGRVLPEKGVHVLLQAVRLLEDLDFKVTIVGRPGFDASAPLSRYERRLHRLAAQSSVPVQFAGLVQRADLPHQYHESDILVVPSVFADPCPLTLLEGMASGLACVASDTGGIPELLGTSGLLFKSGSHQELAVQLRRAITDESHRQRLASSARTRAEGFSWSHTYRLVMNALARV